MGTSAVSTPPSWLSLTEMFANLGLVGLQVSGIVPPGTSAMASELEQAITPLVSDIANNTPTTQQVLAGFGAATAILGILKGKTSDPKLLSSINAQMDALSKGAAAFVAGESGAPDLTTLEQPVPTV